MKTLHEIWKANVKPKADVVGMAVTHCYDEALSAAKKGSASCVCHINVGYLSVADKEKIIDTLKSRYGIDATINETNIVGMYGWAY